MATGHESPARRAQPPRHPIVLMDFRLISLLIRLRYRLLWANVRSRKQQRRAASIWSSPTLYLENTKPARMRSRS